MHLEVKQEECCGCAACKNICSKNAISMVEDEEGFLYPHIDENNCIDCGLCAKICSFMKDKPVNTIKRVYAVKRSDKKKRLESQSGGAFSATAESFLAYHKRRKQNASIYGVIYQDGYVHYSKATNLVELKKQYGSKYVQAVVGDVFQSVKRDLEKGGWVLFSGTSCHVDGLLSFLRQTNKQLQIKLYTCDIVCHGTSSPILLRDYISLTEKRLGRRIQNFNFRNKRHNHANTFELTPKSILEFKHLIITGDYTKLFYSNAGLRPSCFHCQYTNLNRVSDITICDYWGIEKTHPEFDDNTGVSAFMLNTEKAIELFAHAKESGIDYIETSVDECRQPNLQYPTEKPENREAFWEAYRNEGFEPAIRRYCGYEPEKDYEYIATNRIVRRAAVSVKRFVYRFLQR